jgi:hypothetical protein
VLSEAASADTAEQRRARETVWTARRQAQAARQRDRGWGGLSRGKRARLKRRLRSAALRYLPQRAVLLFRGQR